MEKYIVELINLPGISENVPGYLEEYINWAESKGFEIMDFSSLSSQSLFFFKRREIVDIEVVRPSQHNFNKWRSSNGFNS